MRRSSALKMSLVGAVVALGVFAADDSRTKDMNKGKADAAFVEEAALASVNEIKISQLAVSQSTNPSVKELAQQMIDDHTKAFDSLKEIAGNKGIVLPIQSVGASSGKGSTGSMGSSGSTGSSNSDTTGTTLGGGLGSTGSTGSSGSMGTGSTGSTGTGSVGSTTGSGTGSGTSGSVGSPGTMGSDPTVTAAPPSMGDPAASGERMGAGDRMNTDSASTYGALPRPMQKKYDDLAKLTGDRFDRQYLGNIIENHKKSIRIFERESKGGEDSELKSWSTNTLPTLKHHLDMAQSVEREVKNRRSGSM